MKDTDRKLLRGAIEGLQEMESWLDENQTREHEEISGALRAMHGKVWDTLNRVQSGEIFLEEDGEPIGKHFLGLRAEGRSVFESFRLTCVAFRSEHSLEEIEAAVEEAISFR